MAPSEREVFVLLIDVFNVLHVTGVLPPSQSGLDIDGLAAMIARSRYRRHQALLVCDGVRTESAWSSQLVRVVSAGPGREADDAIESFLVGRVGRTVMVVSDDRRLRFAARRARARWLSSGKFLAHLSHDALRVVPNQSPSPRRSVPLDAGEVESWIRRFGLKDADAISEVFADPGGVLPVSPEFAAGEDDVRPRKSVGKPESRSSERKTSQVAKEQIESPDPALKELVDEFEATRPGQIDLGQLDMDRFLSEDDSAS